MRQRISVRGLVEFTLHGEDIRPGASLRDMQEGTVGHKARQALLGEGWGIEVPVRLLCAEGEEVELEVIGRMDAFRDDEVPEVEEIKLWQPRTPPETPLPAHRAQAVCYAHMVCREKERARIRVAYVRRDGGIVRAFDEEHTAAEYAAEFNALLLPYLRRLKLVYSHMLARDASLRALRFPYEGYRPGQREMAVQVYTAIRQGRRLFAELPTGTGKSMAALFPALKALGLGETGRLYYLTARTTQRQGPREALALLRRQPLHLWTLTLDAKDRQCPKRTVCHPDWCPRAKGHFLRDGEAIDELLRTDDWSPEAIRAMAEKHCLCPFELSLSLAELADVTVCDYNYALDPAVHIQRIFDRTSDVTLLIDEAHNLLGRVREMLSGSLDAAKLRRLRAETGKAAGRRHPLYKALNSAVKALTDLPADASQPWGRLSRVPQSVDRAADALCDAMTDARMERLDIDWELMTEVASDAAGFRRARSRDTQEYAWLWSGHEKTRTLTAFSLRPGDYFRETTAGMRGIVCFSATLTPLNDMKRLLGGEEADACFAMPSPFPPENLLVLAEDADVRYKSREQTAARVSDAIRRLVTLRPGKYIAFFPSFSYMTRCAEELADTPHTCQERGMSIEEREAFLKPYTEGTAPVLSLCVMGGVFSEGIDLPGSALDGVIIVGVGLPQVNMLQQTLREEYDRTLGNGFRYAYEIPGMQKVVQAAGRVIRTETDRGVVLLLDDRYRRQEYLSLCPPFWQLRRGDMAQLLRAFDGEKYGGPCRE